MAKAFSVCVLCYGPHTDLARRCLDSIAAALDQERVADVRVGLNAAADASAAYVRAWAARLPVPCLVFREAHGRNVHKYPLMRRMVLSRFWPAADRVMWFDDDSYLLGADSDWWRRVEHATLDAETTGSVFKTGSLLQLHKAQAEAISAQRWYRGSPLVAGHRVQRFATGGWWVTWTRLLREWNYPFPELRHNGGDWLWGELCAQQGYQVKHWLEGVAVNFDAARGGQSTAKRRGDTTPQPYLDWRPGVAADLAHQDFTCLTDLYNQHEPAPR